jgi:hypothetical protein
MGLLGIGPPGRDGGVRGRNLVRAALDSLLAQLHRLAADRR